MDLIFDDASHLYEPTRSSFETLFPLLPEGGLYIIEDWAWAHWKSHASPDHPWAKERPLTQWIFELVEAIGSSTERIQSVEIHQGIAIIERGRLPASEFGSVHLKDWISRRQPPIPDLRTRVRSAVGRLWPA